MATKLTTRKPKFSSRRSHAMNETKVKQDLNLQTKKINGVRVTLSAREWKTMKKAA